MNARKILVVTPSVPFPESGAEQSDRAHGVRQLKRLGYEVRVIAKMLRTRKEENAVAAREALGVDIRTVLYRARGVGDIITRLTHPRFLDGAAYEYADPALHAAIAEAIAAWKPDLLWCDYTYLWPVFSLAQRSGIPIIVRSHNYEPEHFLQEDGRTAFNYLRAVPKYWSERMSALESSHLFSISPAEERTYRTIGARGVSTLPLRGLHPFFEISRVEPTVTPLRVAFSGSTYNVAHNAAAARFLIHEVIPRVNDRYPDSFEFHVTGRGLPPSLTVAAPGNFVYRGYVSDMMDFCRDMHVAIVPSLFGAGMQQKVFEPICRGIPTIASERGLAGYPFESGRHVLVADDADAFADALGALRDRGLRERISRDGREAASGLFSRESIDRVVSNALRSL